MSCSLLSRPPTQTATTAASCASRVLRTRRHDATSSAVRTPVRHDALLRQRCGTPCSSPCRKAPNIRGGIAVPSVGVPFRRHGWRYSVLPFEHAGVPRRTRAAHRAGRCWGLNGGSHDTCGFRAAALALRVGAAVAVRCVGWYRGVRSGGCSTSTAHASGHVAPVDEVRPGGTRQADPRPNPRSRPMRMWG